MNEMRLLVPKIPVVITGNTVLDIVLIIWGLGSAALALGLFKCIGTPWKEISPLNKIAPVSLILYFIVVSSLGG